jgi:hypothetical protein
MKDPTGRRQPSTPGKSKHLTKEKALLSRQSALNFQNRQQIVTAFTRVL